MMSNLFEYLGFDVTKELPIFLIAESGLRYSHFLIFHLFDGEIVMQKSNNGGMGSLCPHEERFRRI